MGRIAVLPIVLLAWVLFACGEGTVEVGRRIPAPGIFVFTQGVDLWIQDEDGARLLIAAEQDQQLLQPSISPDGTRVAYVVFQLTQAEGATIGTDLAIAELSNPTQVILVQHARQAEFVWTPRWSPDGESLIFTHEPGNLVIRIARFDLRDREVEILREDARDADLSPDGTRLVFVNAPYSGDPHLVVRDLSDGGERVLDPDRQWQPRPFRIPQFSADGAAIIFSGGEFLPQVSGTARGLNGPEDIWRYDLASGDLIQLAAIGEDQPDFALSDDGSHVLILGTFGIYLVADPPRDPPFAIAPGEFHGNLDWIGSVSEAEWAEISESVVEIPAEPQ
jgi:Tol biopolymer transport system component